MDSSQDHRAQHHELFLQEIEGIDDYWGPTFRAIYDGDEHQKFMERLDARIKSHDKDIERMCNFHYQGFIDSIRELLQVRSQAKRLNSEVVQLDEDLQESVSSVLLKGEELVQARKVESNIASAIENLSLCLPTAEQLGSDPSVVGRKKRQAPPPPNPFTGEVDYEAPAESTYDAEEDLSAQDLIDFSPVYRCLHIYTVLGSRETFETYYRKQRKKQARLVLQPPTNMHETIAGYRAYIHGIVGFFVVEDHVLNTGNGLVNRTYLDEVWNMALSKIVNALRTHSAYCTDAALMLKIKNLIMLFNTTLRNYGYSVNQLFDLLHEIRDHYNEVLMQRWVQVFREILDEESFLPIQARSFCFKDLVVTSQAEYDHVVESFPFHDEALELAQFPKKFPFSPLVPKVYQQVKEFIYACLKFSEDLNLSQAQVDDMIRKSTNLLLTRSFSGCLSSLFRKPSIALLQVIQIIIDTGYLEDATVFLEEFVSNITGAPKEGHMSSRSQGQSTMFRVARDDAERQICDKLKCKLDEFLELENYDWLLGEPKGHASKFAASEPVAGLEEGMLLQYFADLRQLLDLFMTWDWPTYFHDYGQENSKYQQVNPNTAIILLEKLREADKKTVFSVLKKSERDKKKLLETVLKQLRQLAQTAQQHS
ncbi:Exocyst complex component 6 [Gryllus bimaculatus]|nr:Exocyst complex component 6 [Gryllus bimaculatus]